MLWYVTGQHVSRPANKFTVRSGFTPVPIVDARTHGDLLGQTGNATTGGRHPTRGFFTVRDGVRTVHDPMPETYYDRLGVSSDATTAAIERAYRERLVETHPDVSDAPDAGERTRGLIEAKAVLTDERERARYDRLGHEAYVDNSDGSAPADGTDAGERRPGGRTAGVEHPSAPGADSAGTGNPDRSGSTNSRRRHRQGRAGWNAGGRAPDGHVAAGRGPSGRTENARQIYREDQAHTVDRLFPTQESIVLLASAFLLYPVMLWASLEPAFPLVVNLAVGACLLLVVVFLLGMPNVGMAVFGAWSALLPALLVGVFGVDLISPVGVVAVLATAVPLGLSVLVRVALRA